MTETALATIPTELHTALATVQDSLASEIWRFCPIDDWRKVGSLNEALPILATMETGHRYLWWVCGDVAEALLREFGRTEEIKKQIGAVMGCSVRTVEYRVAAAVEFPPDQRHADVPIRLYKEALSWDDPPATLEGALEEGLTSDDLRMTRLGDDGQETDYLLSGQRATLNVERSKTRTYYTIGWDEKGAPRFRDCDYPMQVIVSLRRVIGKDA